MSAERVRKPKLYRVVTMKRWSQERISEYTYTVPAMSKAQALRCECISPGEVVMHVALVGAFDFESKVWIPKPCTP